jgi:capsular polysaccharide biosynthesis protein
MNNRRDRVRNRSSAIIEAERNTLSTKTSQATTATSDVLTLLRVLVYNSWVIILVTLLGGAASFAFVRLQTPVYESHTTLIISPRVDLDQGRTLEGIRVLQQNVVGTYVQILSSSSVRSAATETLQGQYALDALGEAEVSVRPVENSTVMIVTVRSEYPTLARDLADAVAREVVSNNPVPALLETYPVQILDTSFVPNEPASPQGVVNMALGVAGSLVLGVGLAFLVEEFKKSRSKRRRRSA